ncbi:MAG: hypothetical protein QXO91_06410 [Desulfurococcaceae archaeon]
MQVSRDSESEEREEREAFRKLEEDLARSTPSIEELERALDKLARDVELARDEKSAVLRDLERVWHIMRLLKLLSEYFGDLIFFGGGAVVNYIYLVNVGEKPRFTFDLDSAWRRPAYAKRDVLRHFPLFNKWLAEMGFVLRIPVGRGRYGFLGIAEYDVEKDYFPSILSMRMPVLTRYTGEDFHSFLEIKDHGTLVKLRRAFEEVIGVRNPKIDYVRFEIALGLREASVVRVELKDLFGSTQSVLVTEPELQLAWSITNRIGRSFDAPELALHDILKSALDLRLSKYLSVNRVRDYVLRTEKPETIRANAALNLRLLREKGFKEWAGHHYVLVRKVTTLEDVIRSAEILIENMPGTS